MKEKTINDRSNIKKLRIQKLQRQNKSTKKIPDNKKMNQIYYKTNKHRDNSFL